MTAKWVWDDVPRLSVGDLARQSVLTFGDGYRTRRDELGRSGYPILRVAQVVDGSILPDAALDYVREEFGHAIGPKLSRLGDVVLTTKGTFGRRAYVRSENIGYAYSPQVCFFRVEDQTRLHPRYLYYWLGSQDFKDQTHGMKSQTDMADYLSLRDLSRITIPIPLLDIQHRLLEIVGTLDDKIELNRRMGDTLEAMARALYTTWFVDFTPVRAKAEGRDPDLPVHLSPRFPDTFIDTPLGAVPAGWSVGALGNWATLTIGGDWGADDPSERQSVKVRCLRGVDLHRLRSGGWSEAPIRYVSRRSLEERASTPRDVLVEGSGECGRSLAMGAEVASLYPEPALYSNFCKRIRLGSPAQAVYVERLLNHLVRSGEMKSFVTGTAMPNLDLRGLLSGLTVVMPDSQVLEAFSNFDSLVRYRRHMRESTTLAEIRDTLLPKLMSGELHVKDAEGIAVEAGA